MYNIGETLTRIKGGSSFVVSDVMETCGGRFYGEKISGGTVWTSESWVK